jgi:hypothetical protein
LVLVMGADVVREVLVEADGVLEGVAGVGWVV